MSEKTQVKKYDCFISHASEDKEGFVRKLAESLKNKGVNVWYDEYELTIGDSLRESIDKGLKESVCGLVVLSKNFFEKNWTDYELNGLVARQNSNGQKIILPIWHNISREDVIEYSPSLADLLAGDSKSDIETLARTIKNKIEKIKNNKLDIDFKENSNIHNELIEKYENETKKEKSREEIKELLETFIVDDRYRIKLFNLINSETEKLVTILQSDFEGLAKITPTNELIYSKILAYDVYCERLILLLVNGIYWDNNNSDLWVNSFKKILNSQIMTSGYTSLIKIQLYPALLIYYSILLVSILKNKYKLMGNIFNCINYKMIGNDSNLAINLLYSHNIIDDRIVNACLGKNYHTPMSDHLHDILKPYFSDFISNENEYSEVFDILEYFLHLQFASIQEDKERFWAPIGRFQWRNRDILNRFNKKENFQSYLLKMVESNSNEIFGNNLLGGKKEEFPNLVSQSDEFLKNIRFY